MIASSVSPVPNLNLLIHLKISPDINTKSSHCESIILILLPRTSRAFSGLVHQYRSIHVNQTLTITQEKISLEQAIWPRQLGCLAQAQWSSSSFFSRKVKPTPADQETAQVSIKMSQPSWHLISQMAKPFINNFYWFIYNQFNKKKLFERFSIIDHWWRVGFFTAQV